MSARLNFAASLLALLVLAACQLPGRPTLADEVPRPSDVLDSATLFRQNCSGCHGAAGKDGAAFDLSDPVYLAIVSDDTLRDVISKGRPGTAMSAFARSQGGMLTDQQIDAIIHGIRQRWARPDALAGVAAPPYAAGAAGDAQHGEAVYDSFCASCHGDGMKDGPKAGSILNPAYLSLISNQGLRTLVITGRPDFQAPDWRGNVPGHPMTDQQISDVVAWLASQRPALQPAAASAAASRAGGVQ